MPSKTTRKTPPARPGKKGGSGKRRPPVAPVKKGLPWGMISAVAAVVVFAAAVIGYAVYASNQAAKPPEDRIAGVVSEQYQGGQHVATDTEKVAYDRTPPMGGKHYGVWADCTGTVYSEPIRNNYAVHGLEHGAVWITYDPSLPKAQVNELADLVRGNEYMMMSPYPDQGAKISLQSWGHQLKVDSASDKRIKEFIAGFKHNPNYTPEYGASCSNPDFKKSPKRPL